jgi:hypothetical protein
VLRAWLGQSFDPNQRPEKVLSFEEISSYEEVGRIDTSRGAYPAQNMVVHKCCWDACGVTSVSVQSSAIFIGSLPKLT